MQQRVSGERATVPELDAWLARSRDPMVAELAARVSVGFERRDAQALVALALDFWTWRRLEREGLGDAAAAELMTGVVSGRSRGSCPPARRAEQAPRATARAAR